ncbi:tripartite tricarboxylate transporter TctB family protein [Palleronia sediminis]|uniref:Tripartite tricarboxylate transporter TctB family protein n=1 Tax=Palleronia sediminis TaxID=2547833 RepID=A0A4R6ADR8_9RHOB|nr:tripartite tricarboxylate transporter TctB family protein [Palleronia sediminis]TDL81152.1 tripartite tricarboxylate transporter TctB family protein [Palleronia sediminis]
MRRAEIVTAGLLALLSMYIMWKSTELQIGYIRGQGPGGGAWPFWLAAICLVSTGFIALNWWRGTSGPSQSDEPFLDSYGRKMLVLVGGGIVGFVVLTYIFSMYGAMALFLLYYIGFLGRHRWWVTLILATAIPTVFFFFFEALMRITLPKGMPFLEPFFNYMNTIIY